MIDNSYSLLKIQPQNTAQVLDFIFKNFVISQPLSVFLKTSVQQIKISQGELFAECCRSDVSFMFRKDQEIVAAVLAVKYYDYIKPIPVPQHCAPKIQIFVDISQRYQPKNPQKSLYLCVGCTLSSQQGKGLIKKIIEKIQKQAKQKGFVEILGDCTNPGSENVLKKIGYEEMATIYYKDYECQGIKFDGVVGSEKLCLLSKLI